MKAEGSSPSRGKARAVLAALTCGFLASCTATSGPGFDVTSPSYNGGGVVSMMADVAASEEADTTTEPTQDTAGKASSDSPGEAARLPVTKAATTEVAAGQAHSVQAERKTADAAQAGSAAPVEDDVAVATAAPDARPEPSAANDESAKATPASTETGEEKTAASDEAAPRVAAVDEPKKKGFLSYFFSPQPAKAAPSPIVKQAPASGAEEKPTAAAQKEKTPLIDPEDKAKPIIKLASVDPQERSVRKAAIVPMDALPGVRQGSLFEISRKDGVDDDSDIDLNEGEGSDVYQVASAAGLARLAPNGLLKARDTVDTACLKPALVRMLKTVEQRFGKKLIITSGYRSRDHNRKVRGARNSMHMYCAAADVLMPGVSKWEIAQFVRAMPGRGGVGTYCHTNAVHIDVGPERDWNWRCRRRKAS